MDETEQPRGSQVYAEMLKIRKEVRNGRMSTTAAGLAMEAFTEGELPDGATALSVRTVLAGAEELSTRIVLLQDEADAERAKKAQTVGLLTEALVEAARAKISLRSKQKANAGLQTVIKNLSQDALDRVKKKVALQKEADGLRRDIERQREEISALTKGHTKKLAVVQDEWNTVLGKNSQQNASIVSLEDQNHDLRQKLLQALAKIDRIEKRRRNTRDELLAVKETLTDQQRASAEAVTTFNAQLKKAQASVDADKEKQAQINEMKAGDLMRWLTDLFEGLAQEQPFHLVEARRLLGLPKEAAE